MGITLPHLASARATNRQAGHWNHLKSPSLPGLAINASYQLKPWLGLLARTPYVAWASCGSEGGEVEVILPFGIESWMSSTLTLYFINAATKSHPISRWRKIDSVSGWVGNGKVLREYIGPLNNMEIGVLTPCGWKFTYSFWCPPQNKLPITCWFCDSKW